MSNANFNAQDPNHPVAGGYIQPSTGVTGAVVTLSDVSGNAQKTIGASGGLAYFGTAGYRDQTVTVQNSATASAPTAGTAIATLTTPAAGTYEIYGTASISGTTVAAADSNNINLKKGGTTLLTNIPIAVNGTTGAPGSYTFGPLIITLDGATSVTATAVGNATASSIYAVQLVGRLVG